MDQFSFINPSKDEMLRIFSQFDLIIPGKTIEDPEAIFTVASISINRLAGQTNAPVKRV